MHKIKIGPCPRCGWEDLADGPEKGMDGVDAYVDEVRRDHAWECSIDPADLPANGVLDQSGLDPMLLKVWLSGYSSGATSAAYTLSEWAGNPEPEEFVAKFVEGLMDNVRENEPFMAEAERTAAAVFAAEWL